MLFRIIYADSGEIASQETFASAKEAQAARPILEIQTGKKTRIARVTGSAWRERETALFANGTRKPLPQWWLESPWWQENQAIHADHFPHMSVKNPGSIAFTESPDKGARDIQTPISPSRYLARFFADILRPEDIAAISARFAGGDAILQIASTPEAFADVYTRATEVCAENTSVMSCMSPHYSGRGYNRFASLPHHPAYVYGAGDLAIAYVEREGEGVVSRAVIWPECKKFVRLYGNTKTDCATLRALLEEQGYHGTDSFAGARILKHEFSRGYLMPYIDGDDQGVDDRGDYFKISTCPDFECNNTCGYIEDEETSRCEHCGTHLCDYDDQYNVQGELWCESCCEDDSFYCEHYKESFPVSHGTVTVYTGRTNRLREETWSARAAHNYAFHCDATDKHYSNYDFTGITVQTASGMEVWCVEVMEDDFFADDTERYFSCEDFTEVSVTEENGPNVVYCLEKPHREIFQCEACGEYHVMELMSKTREGVCEKCALQDAPACGRIDDDTQIALAL